jgi:pimeloyl-ACP methyl ester carboxylesterase
MVQAEGVQASGPDHFGAAGPYLTHGVARTFHEFLPGSELFLMPGARHFVQMDEPEQVARSGRTR